MANPKLFRIIDKAVSMYSMIENGDRILLGASGGKDSTALAEYFSYRLKRKDINFEVTAMHIETNLSPPFSDKLKSLFCQWNIPLVIKQVNVLERLKPEKQMNCWWCSTQRRTELNQFAMKNRYNKIALGHHLDDILETILMNALTNSCLEGMPPKLKFQKYPVTLIRPLALADIKTIKQHAENQGYITTTCTCNYQSNSHRKTARTRLDLLTDGKYELKKKLFHAFRNINTEYLP
ncbi:MAG: tRNA 2-thiocytidine(32) synthetase TtcA [Treponema sp.]|nr:MAG: tRNA 2-thiocytidine(32) synthetase TtcA [Treponema sp.]